MPRILAAVVAVIAMHAAALVLRPDVSGGQMSTPTTSVLIVRTLHPALLDAPTPKMILDVAPVPSATSAQEHKADPAPKSHARAFAKSSPAREQSIESPASSSQVRTPVEAQPNALAAAPNYVLGIQLDPGPRPLDEIDPEYPDPVRLRSGTVELRLLISDTGHVDDVSVIRAEPAGVFEQAAIEAFSKARFAPGMAGGRPVKSQIRVEVEFMPINRGGRISGRSY